MTAPSHAHTVTTELAPANAYVLPCESRRPENTALHPDPLRPPPAVAVSTGRRAKGCCGALLPASSRMQLICACCVVAVTSRRFRCTDCGANGLRWTDWYTLAAINPAVVAA
jgi:hypothetical protein